MSLTHNKLSVLDIHKMREILKMVGKEHVGRTKRETINLFINLVKRNKRKKKKKKKIKNVYTDMDLFVAQVIEQSYRTERKEEIGGLIYRKDLSTPLWAHYSNKERVVIGIHGADDIELNILAIRKFIDPSSTSDILNEVCDMLNDLLDDERDIIVAGHSVGGYAINNCLSERDYPYSFISFGSYTPQINPEWSNNKVRKHLYKTDWLANNLLKADNNCLVYDSKGVNTHGLFLYLNKKKMNKNFVKKN